MAYAYRKQSYKASLGRKSYVKAVPATKIPFVWHPTVTAQQTAFWDAMTAGGQVRTAPHIMLVSRAGTGKTYTGNGGLFKIKDIDPWASIAFVAFGKMNAEELEPKVPVGCTSCTSHSLGKRMLNAAGINAKVDIRQYGKSMDFLPEDMPYALKTVIGKTVSLCKAFLYDGTDREQLLDLAADFDIDFGKETNAICDAVPMVLRKSRENIATIDFDDMIWLPVVLNLSMAKFDVLVIDEFQDWNAAQRALAMRAGHRIVVIFDDRQSIFGFRGADVDGIDAMRTLLAADNPDGTAGRGVVELGLTVSQRCKPAIVQFAQSIVPDFQANPDAWAAYLDWQDAHPDASYLDSIDAGYGGVCMGIDCEATYKPGDMVICRTNAPLIVIAYECIRANIPVVIQGRDIGSGLVLTIKKMVPVDASALTLIEVIASTFDADSAKIIAANGARSGPKLQALQDRMDCLTALCEGMDTVQQVLDRIQALFIDAKAGDASKFVWLSSVHKAKGLESDTVFVIRPELMPHPMAKTEKQMAQESNLQYVAITRAKTSLHWH